MKIFAYMAVAFLALPTSGYAEDCSSYPRQPGIDAQAVEGFVVPRIIATGRAVPFSEDVEDVYDAYDEARDEALRQVTEFMEVQTSSSVDRERLTEKITEQSGNTREASKTQVETLVRVWSRSSSALLRGFVGLGDCYTPPSLVLVSIGLKPETIQAAEGLAAGMADSLTTTPTMQTRGDGRSLGSSGDPFGSEKTGESTVEEDSLRRLPGSSNTGRLDDF